jgi:hypothetical protein
VEKPFVDFTLGSLRNLKASHNKTKKALHPELGQLLHKAHFLIATDRVRQRSDLRPACQNAAGIQCRVCTRDIVGLRTMADRKLACKQGRSRQTRRPFLRPFRRELSFLLPISGLSLLITFVSTC